ncbi:hypothetical protein B0H13DRAFT_1892018 [Mycena leptocephala]|nr:hypothetical protein B0H13DRAFT_1892018 [Mycena leptocephala]
MPLQFHSRHFSLAKSKHLKLWCKWTTHLSAIWTGKTQIGLKFIKESASRFSNIFLIDTSATDKIVMGLKNIASIKQVGDEENEHQTSWKDEEVVEIQDPSGQLPSVASCFRFRAVGRRTPPSAKPIKPAPSPEYYPRSHSRTANWLGRRRIKIQLSWTQNPNKRRLKVKISTSKRATRRRAKAGSTGCEPKMARWLNISGNPSSGNTSRAKIDRLRLWREHHQHASDGRMGSWFRAVQASSSSAEDSSQRTNQNTSPSKTYYISRLRLILRSWYEADWDRNINALATQTISYSINCIGSSNSLSFAKYRSNCQQDRHVFFAVHVPGKLDTGQI